MSEAQLVVVPELSEPLTWKQSASVTLMSGSRSDDSQGVGLTEFVSWVGLVTGSDSHDRGGLVTRRRRLLGKRYLSDGKSNDAFHIGAPGADHSLPM